MAVLWTAETISYTRRRTGDWFLDTGSTPVRSTLLWKESEEKGTNEKLESTHLQTDRSDQ